MPAERVTRIPTMDNFWQMGDTGPCGPCTEIFYDHGPDVEGGPPGSEDAEGDRFIEIWNLVFMQYNRDEKGTLHPLPKPSVDTGMGLERIAAVLQGVHSNYEIDLFQDLIRAAARETGATDLDSNSLKVIADHIRACAFLVTDDVIPGNEGRGYVLRRIVRRAIRHGYKLGKKTPFFHALVPDLVQTMGEAYPELVAAQERVMQVLKQEEERFAETLHHGMEVLEGALKREDRMLDGEMVFKLYDTFGFPVDLTADIARERGITVDFAGFEEAMQRQRERARAASRFQMQSGVDYVGRATEFHGYDTLTLEGEVVALYRAGTAVKFIEAGQEAVVVLDQTPFYAESGGQVGDIGELHSGNGTFTVSDTQKIQAVVFGHKGLLRTGRLALGDQVMAHVDPAARARTMYNHSSTHLMHAALRKVLGTHVTQKGSLVDQWKTRFDFSHPAPMTSDEIRRVEALVNEQIRRNSKVQPRHMKYDEAIKSGAMALFGEKYGDEVRVIGMGDFSTELCGGTHVSRTGDIGLFKILSEGGVAAGIRRVEATTGESALAHVQQQQAQLEEVAASLKTPTQEVTQKISQIVDNVKLLEKELARLKSKLASSQGDDLAGEAVAVKGTHVLAVSLDGADSKALREAMDKLKDKLKSAAIVLASVEGERVSLVVGVTPGPHGEGEGRRARQLRGGAGRRERRRAAGHGAGGRHRARASARGSVLGEGLGGATAGLGAMQVGPLSSAPALDCCADSAALVGQRFVGQRLDGKKE